MQTRRLVLASRSTYRAAMLAEAGLVAETDPSGVDERALDHLFVELGPTGFALELALRKAEAVAVRHGDSTVIGADQVGVLTTPDGPVQLTQHADEESAVAQLVAMSGTTHELVNGVVLIETATGHRARGTDVQRVTMRSFTPEEASSYVRRFRPLDCSGSYRLEDQDRMAPLEGFVTSVEGEHDSGVRGLPLPLLHRLLASLDASGGR